MIKPELPSNEQARLKCLRSLNILDTQSEERFDRITRMAKRLFDVPIALVSLIDENRQWFKSCIGLDVSQTGREESFCGHAILDDEVFVIPDASQDLRFFDNPLVVSEPNIRFYAGCQLKFTGGFKLGTLCIIDTKPREFSKDDVEALKDLALTVESEMASVEMAIVDELTQVLNRRGFLLLGKNSLNLCERQKIPATLAYFDLNNFKPLNDEFGHAYGDSVLKEFCAKVSAFCGEADIFARVGGDEFSILFVNSTVQECEAFMMKLQKTIMEVEHDNLSEPVSFSYGFCEFNFNTEQTIESLMSVADIKMYEHKRVLQNRH